MSSSPPLGAAKVKRRGRGDKRHRHTMPCLLKAVGIKTAFPYNNWRLWDCFYLNVKEKLSDVAVITENGATGCDENCLGPCVRSGAGKCDSDCRPGFAIEKKRHACERL